MGTGDAECSDGTTANYKFDSATSSKGSGSGETAKEDSSFLRMDIQNLQQEFCLKKLPAIDYQSLDQN